MISLRPLLQKEALQIAKSYIFSYSSKNLQKLKVQNQLQKATKN